MRLIDTREPWDEIREPLLQLGWEQQTLYHGDFCFTSYYMDWIGGTRKSFRDLLTSIGDVFEAQLERMLEHYSKCILVYEVDEAIRVTTSGHFIIPEVGVSRHTVIEVRNWLHRQWDKGFIPERTAGAKDTVVRLNQLYTLYQKPHSRSSMTRRYADDRVLALPSGTRGKIGERLLQGTSLLEIAKITIPELQALDNIGEKRAYDIYNRFHRR